MKKRLLSLLLALTLLASASVTAAAIEYTDLTGHWAAPYITELSDLGYINGYSDGTVRPDNTITACETIALLSRFYRVEGALADQIHADYGDFVAENIDPTLKWAYDEIEVCLAAGILSKNEIRNLRLTVPVDKELLSVLLVRALQLTDKAAALMDDGVELKFNDANEIAPAYRGHIAVLVNNKIVVGDTHNNFTPHSEVTRGVVATMVVRGLKYVDSLGIELKIPGYNADAASRTGVITGIAGSTVALRDAEGVSRAYTVNSKSALTVGGKAAALKDLSAGLYASVQVEAGAVTSLSARKEEGVSWRMGAVSDFGKTANGCTLNLRDLDTDSVTKLQVANSVPVTVNGVKKTPADLQNGMFLIVSMQGEKIAGIAAASGTYTLKATVASLTYGTPVSLELEADDGGVIHYALDLAAPPAITRGDSPISLERLGAGDQVTLTVEGCKLTKVAAQASEKNLEGILTSVITTTAGTTWLITDSRDGTHSLVLDPAANAYQTGKSIQLSAIQVGDTVSVVSDGRTITEVQLRLTKISGTVLAVDAKAKTVTILTDSKRFIYIDATQVGTILNASNGKTVTLSGVAANTPVVAYGNYKDSSNFNAKSMVLES